jgi:tetratricopeptide (TPR) repeat protein
VLEERPQSAPAADRLAALLGKDDPRASIELLARFAEGAPPSDTLGQRLLGLGDQAKEKLADVELAARMYTQALPMVGQSREVQERLVTLWRDAGRQVELIGALRALAALLNRPEDLPRARAAYEEEANVAEALGRVEDSLHALTRASELCLQAGQKVLAAEHERRKAEIYRDAKRDYLKAQDTLERAFLLYPELRTAQLGGALSYLQKDPKLQSLWLEREAELAQSPLDRGHVRFRLAQLTYEALHDSAKAETLLKDLLRQEPPLPEARELLVRLLS